MSGSHRITAISLIMPSEASSSMTLARKRETFQLEGAAWIGSEETDTSMRDQPVSGSVTIRALGLR